MSWRRYDEARALAYDAERAALDTHVAEVRDVVVAALEVVPGSAVIDVGAGTGLWSDRLVRWTGMRVLAVEPSAAMVAVLASKTSSGVFCVRARGEALPVRDEACGAAWLSTVVHHFEDLPTAAEEVARVLAPGGIALVRSSFPGQPSGDAYPTKFFPTASQVAREFPTLDAVVDSFKRAGLALQRRYAPCEVAAETRLDFLQRVRRRADSLLREVPDAEFATGVQALQLWVEASPDAPVHFRPDVLAFG